MRVLADTSVLIADRHWPGFELAISVVSIAELHFGLSVAGGEGRSTRAIRLGVIEAGFEPIAMDAAVAREWGRLSGAVSHRGGRPRSRAMDLVIAATANVHRVPLLTYDIADLKIIEDLVDIRDAARQL